MYYAYLDDVNDVLATGSQPRDPADIKAPATHRIDNAPPGLSAKAPKDPTNTAYHQWIPANGDGTDLSHYVLIQSLGAYKQARYAEIDARTVELIASGFEYDSEIFSLSQQAQDNWLRLRLDIVGGILTGLDFPRRVSTIDDSNYILPGLPAAAALYAAYSNTIEDRLDTGRLLKRDIRQATTKAEIDALTDDRADTGVDPMGFTTAAKRQDAIDGIYIDWKYEVTNTQGGRITSIQRYATDNGDGTYSDLVQDLVYTYQGSHLLSIVTTTYDTEGAVISTETQTFFSDGTSTTIRKFS